MVLGADSVIDLDGELISKPESREEALLILKKLNGKKHNLISSVCISKNGSMIWNHTDKAELTMKNLSEEMIPLEIDGDVFMIHKDVSSLIDNLVLQISDLKIQEKLNARKKNN